MKIFLSHASRDATLARRIAEGLRREGLTVWLAEEEILPGDNFAEQISQALAQCDSMVALLTSNAAQSDIVPMALGYALGNKAYRHRVLPVLVGIETQALQETLPWILERFRVFRLPQPEQADETVREIAETLLAAA